MLQYLLDTDHLTLYERGHALVTQRVATQQRGDVGISAVTILESLRGKLALLNRVMDGPTRIQRYSDLFTIVQMFQGFVMVRYDTIAENHFQQLRSIRIGAMDLQIAAVAMAHQLILVTRNRRDFGRIPGLTLEDWSV